MSSQQTQNAKREKMDAIVRKLADDSFQLTKLLQEDKPYINELKALDQLIAKLRGLQGHKEPLSAGTRENPKRDWKPFFKWFKDNESPMEDFDVTYKKEKGFGITTTKPINKGDVIFEVPQKFMMTNVTALNSAKSAILIHNDQILQNIYSLSLAVHVLIEKFDQQSFWRPYIDSLPRNLSSPLYWDPAHLYKLEGSKALYYIAKVKATVAKQYAHVYFRLEKQLEFAVMKREAFKWDLFLWAITTIQARQNPIPVTGQRGNVVDALAMIPFFDLVNHEGFGALDEITSEYDAEKNCLRMFAGKDFAAGDEIVMHYGDRANLDLVTFQGFFAPKNPFSYTILNFSLLSVDKLKEQKTQVLEAHQIPPQGSFQLSIRQPVPPALLFFQRVAWSTSEEELARASPDRPISLTNELQAYTMLGAKVKQATSHYPTRLEENIKELANTPQSSSLYLALQLLIEEKKIFQHVSSYITDKITSIKTKIQKQQTTTTTTTTATTPTTTTATTATTTTTATTATDGAAVEAK